MKVKVSQLVLLVASVGISSLAHAQGVLDLDEVSQVKNSQSEMNQSRHTQGEESKIAVSGEIIPLLIPFAIYYPSVPAYSVFVPTVTWSMTRNHQFETGFDRAFAFTLTVPLRYRYVLNPNQRLSHIFYMGADLMPEFVRQDKQCVETHHGFDTGRCNVTETWKLGSYHFGYFASFSVPTDETSLINKMNLEVGVGFHVLRPDWYVSSQYFPTDDHVFGNYSSSKSYVSRRVTLLKASLPL